jgi:aryl-alcohol dehydrogenase-like predicted oxidoreductase
VPRDKVTVLTKTWARDAASARADLDRFRRELGIDHIDVCLIHCVTEGDWTERFKGVMDVLSEAKQKGIIRAHGCSCHSLEALRAAAKSAWVEIDLARINPIGSHMDADPETVVGVLREMKAAGKAVVGMKILGQGDLRGRQSEALRYALSLGVLDAFTIGAESKAEPRRGCVAFLFSLFFSFLFRPSGASWCAHRVPRPTSCSARHDGRHPAEY